MTQQRSSLLLTFSKLVGTGNDFIIVDGTNQQVPEDLSRFAGFVCRAHVGIGADGLVVIQRIVGNQLSITCWNPDGSRATMCGNAVRSSALYAMTELGIERPSIELNSNVCEAVREGDLISVTFSQPTSFRGPLHIEDLKVFYIHTGTEHVVTFAESIDEKDVLGLGARIRRSSALAPHGANVDFVEVLDEATIKVRTYEKGVEAETLSCGSGAVAAALVSRHLNLISASKIRVMNRTSSPLLVSFSGQQLPFNDIWLTGRAAIVFRGEILWNG